MSSAERPSLKEQFQGFPIYQMSIIAILRLVESIADTSTYPYIFPYIVNLKVAKSKTEVSMYIAYLASANSLCQVVSNIYWGRIANKWGRKPVLIIGLISFAISFLFYGFATSFTTVMISKFIKGLFNANQAIVRTVIGEVAHEKRHQALGFSSFALCFNVGFIIGPLIGSELMTPLDKINADNSIPKTFSQRYPFALPNIVICILILTASLIIFLFFEETHYKLKSRYDLGILLGDKIRKGLGFEFEPRPWTQVRFSAFDPEEFELDDATENLNRTDLSVIEEEEEGQDTTFVELIKKEEHSLLHSLKESVTRQGVHIIVNHSIMLAHFVTYLRFLSSFLSNDLHGDKLSFPFGLTGGMGLSVRTISMILSAGGVFGIIVVCIISPYCNKKMGVLKAYRVSLLVYPFIYSLLPLIAYTLPQYSSFPQYIAIGLLYLLNMLKEFAGVLSFSYIFVLLHRSSDSEHISVVNGIAMSVAGLVNFFAPLIGGLLMVHYDSNEHLTIFWWLLALFSVVGHIHSFMINPLKN